MTFVHTAPEKYKNPALFLQLWFYCKVASLYSNIYNAKKEYM